MVYVKRFSSLPWTNFIFLSFQSAYRLPVLLRNRRGTRRARAVTSKLCCGGSPIKSIDLNVGPVGRKKMVAADPSKTAEAANLAKYTAYEVPRATLAALRAALHYPGS